MKTIMKILGFCLVLLLGFQLVSAGEDNEVINKYSLWIGSHYTNFTDYRKKVGKYDLDNEQGFPEFRINYLSQFSNGFLNFNGHYYDDQNINSKAKVTIADKFRAKFQYRSLTHQQGQDLLENISAREWHPLTNSPGGKYLTHQLLDINPDYKTHRQEILSNIDALLSKKNNVHFIIAHRSILTDGSEQKIASDHCFSCHLTSQKVKVRKRTHEFETGLDAETGKFDVGYRFNYRHFESEVADPYAYYDPAVNPVTGGAGAEFSSRMIFNDTTLPYSTYPRTEKMSHKVRFKGNIGKGYLSSSIAYSHAKNKRVNLTTDSWVGGANYAILLNKTTRLLTKVTIIRLSADDPFINLPTFRAGAADGNEKNFDFTRYSALDRTEAKTSAELITRLNKKMVLSILGGYDVTARDDYPIVNNGITTKKLIGQAKLRYRKGLKYASTLKYKYENISDPFIVGKGLFEAPGYKVLTPLVPTSNFVFYFQREGLRYQNITTMPTQVHQFEWNLTYHPTNRYSINLGVSGKYDKNGDLDSLDIKHFSIQPNININLTPNPKWAISAGYTYHYDMSRLPVTVALFDG
ncbi:MAG: hypothetical protein GXO93_03790 [FCB group bacterium]|nr:hypothetical protein [FCB group bacterium]